MDFFEKKATKYFVYRNINKGKDEHHYSLRSKKSGRVERRGQNYYLKNVKFKVSDKGRQRVLAEGRKNVHAGLEGFVTRKPRKIEEWQRVSYNPRKDDAFRDAFKNKIEEANFVRLTPKGIYIPK
jgi:hypothetical protein